MPEVGGMHVDFSQFVQNTSLLSVNIMEMALGRLVASSLLRQ
jgi:hypothetical protein